MAFLGPPGPGALGGRVQTKSLTSQDLLGGGLTSLAGHTGPTSPQPGPHPPLPTPAPPAPQPPLDLFLLHPAPAPPPHQLLLRPPAPGSGAQEPGENQRGRKVSDSKRPWGRTPRSNPEDTGIQAAQSVPDLELSPEES